MIWFLFMVINWSITKLLSYLEILWYSTATLQKYKQQ